MKDSGMEESIYVCPVSLVRMNEHISSSETSCLSSDYRGLKKRITKIRKSQLAGSAPVSQEDVESPQEQDFGVEQGSPQPSTRSGSGRSYGSTGLTPPLHAREASRSPPDFVALPPSTLSLDLHANSDPIPAASALTSHAPAPGPRSVRPQSDNHVSHECCNAFLCELLC